MTNNKPSNPKPIDKEKIGLPVNSHLLRDIARDIVKKHKGIH